ncbi:MAG: RNA-binding protein [Thermodesulfobacteriota bacterium]
MFTKLYVGNLSLETKEEALRTLFEQAGTVESARIITDRYSGSSKGFGFVEMATSEEAIKAVELFNGHSLDGRSLTVSQARERRERGGERQGGYRGR